MMTIFKKNVLVIGVMMVGLASAQSSDMNHMLKVGINGGFSMGKVATASAGASVSYQYLVKPGLGIGLASGYTHFFGNNNEIKNGHINYEINNNDFGVVPIALMVRVYPKKMGFYGGADLGYAFVTGSDKVAEKIKVENWTYSLSLNFQENRPKGGVYLKPEIGWHNRDWNIYLHYTAVLAGDKGDIRNPYNNEVIQNYIIGSLGLGVVYNIPLGK